MNGVHDVGGMQCFGPIKPDVNNTPFDEPWEGRVFGLQFCLRQRGCFTLDQVRDATERLDPSDYLSSTYYQRRLRAMSLLLIEGSLVDPIELARETALFAGSSNRELPMTSDPGLVEDIERHVLRGSPKDTQVSSGPLFRKGDLVRIRNSHPKGHTRLPRYARGCAGSIEDYYGTFPFPDLSLRGKERPADHVYSVRIPLQEIWGTGADPHATITVSVWECQLE